MTTLSTQPPPEFTDAIVRQLEAIRQGLQLLALAQFGVELTGIDPLPTQFGDTARAAITSSIAGAVAGEVAARVAATVVEQLITIHGETGLHYHAAPITVAAPNSSSKRIEHDAAGRIIRIIEEAASTTALQGRA